MKLPKTISVWFMILFFLFAGLSAFGVSLGGAIWGILIGIFALGAAVFLFLGRLATLEYTKTSPGIGEAFFCQNELESYKCLVKITRSSPSL